MGEEPLPRGRRTVEQDPFGVNGADPQRRTPRLDEGTFDALFPRAVEMVPGVKRDIKLSKGEFRMRRQ